MSSRDDGKWRCNKCGEEFTTTEANRAVGTIYCPECGTNDVMQVMG